MKRFFKKVGNAIKKAANKVVDIQFHLSRIR